MGHEIGSGGRSPLKNKVEAIKQLAEPTTKKLLKSFLGGINFYRGYIKNFAEIALPLTELTKNCYPNNLKFNEVQTRAFNNLK